jgi:hypothetical protein
MNCADWEERIALYSSGELAPAEVEGHLASCPGCRVFLQELEANGTALAMLREQPLIVREKPATIFRWLPYAAAIALAVGLGAFWKPAADPLPPVVRTAVDAPRLAPMPRPKPMIRTVRRVKKPEPHESIVVKMLTDDPDVIIYWITD